MVQLCQSVQTQVQEQYKLQKIARMNHNDLKSNPNNQSIFRELASNNFKFVDSWSDNAMITKSTFRVYHSVPVVEAAKDFIAKIKTEYLNRPDELRIQHCLDTFKLIGSRMDWREASTDISTNEINSQTKVAPTLCFFKGAMFECTYNDRNGNFLNSDAALLYDIPNIEDLESWKPVKVLRVPAG